MAELIFEESTHTYSYGGVELPSVTQIMRFLNYDTASAAKSWMRDIAAKRGTRIHEITADIDYGAEPDSIEWECAGYVNAYKKFLRDYRPEWTHIEVRACSLQRGFAGTIDRIGYINKELADVDIKTGAKLHITALSAQLAGYEIAELDYGLISKCPQHYGLQLKKDGDYRLIKVIPAFTVFYACKTIHEALEETK